MSLVKMAGSGGQLACPDLVPVPESTNRCARYEHPGACPHADHPVCEVWLQANPKAVIPPQLLTQIPSDYRRQVVAGTYFSDGWRERLRGELEPASEPVSGPMASPVEAEATELPEGFVMPSQAEIASFKALNAEVCFVSAANGKQVWLVPEYTMHRAGEGRPELSVDDALTLVRLLAAFPGARVTEFNTDPAWDENPHDNGDKTTCTNSMT